MALDLSDPQVFQRVYDEQSRGVYAAAFRILGNAAQAQDVVQDVFLRVWRKPGTFDAKRGELGSYLRLMARSRALDLWRESQAAGRASDRLKVVVAGQEERPARGAGPRLLGRPHRRPDRPALRRAARDGQEPHPARPGEAP